MKITAELSLYPLATPDYKEIIQQYIDRLHTFKHIEVRTHALSTEIFGDYESIMKAVQEATRTVFERQEGVILVAKYLNADRSKAS